MAAGCPENLNLEFLRYVLNFRSAWQARNAAALEGFAGTVHRFARPAAADDWLGSLVRA